jgi:hypothetical protein
MALEPPRAQRSRTPRTERQRTENGHSQTDTWTGANGKSATRYAVVTDNEDAGTRTRNVDCTGPNGKIASVDSVGAKTADGFTRSTAATDTQDETATRDLTVSRDKESGTIARTTDYPTFNGAQGSKSDVIQRTDEGFARETTRNLPNGETHTRGVDASCNGEGKCVKQVEVDQQP